jgi:hypothetical protein
MEDEKTDQKDAKIKDSAEAAFQTTKKKARKIGLGSENKIFCQQSISV